MLSTMPWVRERRAQRREEHRKLRDQEIRVFGRSRWVFSTNQTHLHRTATMQDSTGSKRIGHQDIRQRQQM
ncbi:hypothetical protein KC19_VG253800 [Ceratodon purpureus]|uniref:Uncharacterized protein n=1 Tax=Ceratodon purpureus TaxID=3225 RepID=A0A8T0HU47_CERPU|nr:hypothetical protein KC19_VG253800 [Ceratodon purpureus]